MAPVVPLGALGINGLGPAFEFNKPALPPVKIGSVIEQMSAGVIDALAQIDLDKQNEAEITEELMSEKRARALSSESPFCSAAGPFFTQYRAEYGADLHSCLCTTDVFGHFDTQSGYPPAVGAEAVALTLDMCGCKREFAARYPAEKESMDICRVADSCPGADLVAITTGDFASAPALCASDACAATLADILEEDVQAKSCGWLSACPGLDLDALGAGVMDAASLEVICGPTSGCLDAFVATEGCDAACADGLLTLCPLLGECSAAELAGGMASPAEGLCPADGSKVSHACATAVIGTAGCTDECATNMASCVEDDVAPAAS